MGAAVVAGVVDTALVLKPAEHVLDCVELPVEDAVRRDRHPATGF